MLRRNVLIFHQAALGDFVITWPLAMACGRMFPQSRIIYVTASEKGRLAEHVLGVESVDIESGWSGLWSDPAALAPGARKMLEGAHAVFSFIADAADLWTRHVATINPEAQVAHLSTKLGENWRGHVSRAVAQQLQTSQPALSAAVGQMLDLLDRRGFGRRPASRGGVVVFPGSGAERKNWPRQRFVETVARLKSAGRAVRVIIGEVELEKWGPSAADEFSRLAQVTVSPSLVELAQLANSAELVIANDSGPGHLAGILGAPTISLFGPTSQPTRWRPLGPNVRVIAADSMEAISVDQVLAAAAQFTPAEPESRVGRGSHEDED